MDSRLFLHGCKKLGKSEQKSSVVFNGNCPFCFPLKDLRPLVRQFPIELAWVSFPAQFRPKVSRITKRLSDARKPVVGGFGDPGAPGCAERGTPQ